MADLGAAYTDKEIEKLTHKINGIYKEAQEDINAKMKDFNAKYKVKEAKYAQQVHDGKMTQDEFDRWKKGQVFQGKQWQAKKNDITNVLHNSNVLASQIINNERINAFGFNANYASYSIEKDAGVNFGFDIYDRDTVINLIKNEPNLLPKYTPINGIDKAWNSKKITRQVTLGIIEGESLDKIADRLARVTSSQNRDSMLTHARTLMTGAQNAGRLQSYKHAADLGIELEKQWMATFDAHTRDSHRRADGETQPIDREFSTKCMYPGDPGGPPKEVYNCRCTMVSETKKYPMKYKRYDNIDGKPIENMSYKEWAKAKGLDQKKKQTSAPKNADSLWNNPMFNSSDAEKLRNTLMSCGDQDMINLFLSKGANIRFELSDKGDYSDPSGVVHLNVENLREESMFNIPYKTAFHEMIHSMDNAKFNSDNYDFSHQYGDGILTNTIKKEGKAFKEEILKRYGEESGVKYGSANHVKHALGRIVGKGGSHDFQRNQMTYGMKFADTIDLSDMLEFSLKIDSPLSGGHGLKYWKNAVGTGASEFIAEYGASLIANPASARLMEQAFPESCSIARQIFKELAK